MHITIFGLGFVGLTTALGLASKGHTVYGIDVDAKRLQTIATGELPFLEPELDLALQKEQNIHFFLTEQAKEAVQKSECIFFCVGTPYGMDGEADLKYLFSAMNEALSGIDKKQKRVFAVKSTIPPSTIQERVIPYLKQKTDLYGTYLMAANNPEFLREGHCWEDFMHPDRIVLGVADADAEEILRRVYKDFDCPIFAVSPNTGEFIKYLSNTLLATMISYANEMSLVSDAIGDIETARAFHILHMDQRWNGCDMTSYVYPGCGYGGYCLPKDTRALYALSKKKGFLPEILQKVIQTNDRMPKLVAEKICAKTNPEDCIAILGLSFKPDSDDVRQSPAVPILRYLQEKGYKNMKAYDPVANSMFAQAYPDLSLCYCDTMEQVVDGADTIVILTAWKEFLKIKQENALTKTIDCRYMLE